jgi:hypothetical protein
MSVPRLLLVSVFVAALACLGVVARADPPPAGSITLAQSQLPPSQLTQQCAQTLNPFEAFNDPNGFEKFFRSCYLPQVQQPQPQQCGGDPFLVGLGEGFKQCGTAMNQMLTRVPVLLLTGNFVEAARVLGVQPGQSMVLKTLMQELGERTIGASPHEAGVRIGRRICSYALTVGAGEGAGQGAVGGSGRVRGGGTPEPGIGLPEEPPGAAGTGVAEPVAPRRPSPRSFANVRPDFQKRFNVTNPGSWTSEEIGEAAMMAAAKEKGYWDLLPPERASCTPQGFDAIFWDPETGAIVVGEAKGGYNGMSLDDILGSAYGARQGTIDWAERSAQRTTRGTRTNDLEVRYAEVVFRDAIRDRKVPIRIEVFHTDILNGQPGMTRHYVTDSMP